ncbi:MAG TPA: hypothetical protein VFE24_10885 [Pirellulales bacterium]|jgi:hypothetical protein|nr:hypothetical protein [Pirellulales bacterium]
MSQPEPQAEIGLSRRSDPLKPTCWPRSACLDAKATCAILNVALLSVLSGCGSGNGRLPLYGTVSLSNGEKFSGAVIFLPDQGQTGPAAVASLVDGHYEFERADGPTPGPHLVTIKRVLPKDMNRLLKSRVASKNIEPNEKDEGFFKTDWTMATEIKPDGSLRYDFTVPP